jgi:hypothetical protein
MSGAPGVAASAMSGTLLARQTTNVTIAIQNSNRPEGRYDLGQIILNSSSGNPIEIPVSLIVGDITHIYLPVTVR